MQAHLHSIPERSLRALVLDGDDAALRSLRRALEDLRLDVLCAHDGASGLDLLLEELLSLDVVILDLDLPRRDARALADLVRRAGGERDLAIVVVALGASAAVRAELVAMGVDAVVDRSEGPRAVADAALAAVLSRGSSCAAAEPAPSAQPAAPSGWGLSFVRCAPVAA